MSMKATGKKGKAPSGFTALLKLLFYDSSLGLALGMSVSFGLGALFGFFATLPLPEKLLSLLSGISSAAYSSTAWGLLVGAGMGFFMTRSPLPGLMAGLLGGVISSSGAGLFTLWVVLSLAILLAKLLPEEPTSCKLVWKPLSLLAAGLLLFSLGKDALGACESLFASQILAVAGWPKFLMAPTLSLMGLLSSVLPIFAPNAAVFSSLSAASPLAAGIMSVGISAGAVSLTLLAWGDLHSGGLVALLCPHLGMPLYMRRPLLLLPAFFAAVLTGTISAWILPLPMVGSSSGWGIVGLGSLEDAMASGSLSSAAAIILFLLLHVLFPLLISGATIFLLRRAEWLKRGDCRLEL